MKAAPETPHTNPRGTETTEGYIPHREVFADCGLIHAPVKLVRECEGRIAMHYQFGGLKFPIPLRRDGRLVFALPCGGEFVA